MDDEGEEGIKAWGIEASSATAMMRRAGGFFVEENAMPFEIQAVHGRQVLDSRGNPTVEVEVKLASGILVGRRCRRAPSTGENEAVELRDGDKSVYAGKSVYKAVENVNSKLADLWRGWTRAIRRGSTGR